jgi:iron complex transport system ATP-binding protein
MPAAAPLVELERVGYRQHQVDILREVTWRLNAGEHWAVLGPNGGGKTTLLRIACGYLWPTAGAVRRLGQELLDLRELRRSIGWVAPDVSALVPPGERALDTVVSGKFAQLGLKRYGDTAATGGDFAAARRVLEQLGCTPLADKPFGVLSQGERQQVLVARARMVDPLAIILDEPCAGMDPGARERFLAWLAQRAADAGSPAIVFVTHHVEEIVPGFDRTLVVAAGRIVAAGATHEVVTAELLQRVYGVRVARLEASADRLWPIWG